MGMNNKEFILNDDHIEKIEAIPETMITLTNGKKYIVLDSIDDVRKKIIIYKNEIINYKF